MSAALARSGGRETTEASNKSVELWNLTIGDWSQNVSDTGMGEGEALMGMKLQIDPPTLQHDCFRTTRRTDAETRPKKLRWTDRIVKSLN
jgi:hypothetical protein